MSPDPQSVTPFLPDYKSRISDNNFKTLSMEEISQKISSSRNYWISTSINNKPHSFPIWGIWLENQFIFSSGPNSKKVKNLLQNSYCTITTEDANKPVIIEGIAYREKRIERLALIVVEYNSKYNWEFMVKDAKLEDKRGNGGPVFAVQPQKIFAWNEFPITFSKWVFK